MFPYVFVLEGRVGAFPCGYSAAAVAQRDEAGLDPCRSEAVEEVCLAGYLIFVEVCVS